MPNGTCGGVRGGLNSPYSISEVILGKSCIPVILVVISADIADIEENHRLSA